MISVTLCLMVFAFMLVTSSQSAHNLTESFLHENKPSLRQVLLVHRHGDRTPINFPERDPLRDHPLWRHIGLGALTNEGKARLYKLGQFIRLRYANFLSHERHEVNSRSSGAERCLESGLLLLAGLYAPDARFDQVWDDIEENPLARLWLPIKITTIPRQYDGMLSESALCNKLSEELVLLNRTERAQSLYRRNNHVIKLLQEEIGQQFPTFFHFLISYSLIDIERRHFPNAMRPRVLETMEQMSKAAEEAMAIWYTSDVSIRLRMGLLLNDLLKLMREYDQDKTKIKLHHYSTHDLMVFGLLSTLGLVDKYPHRPGYGATLIIELHQHNKCSRKHVEFFYLSKMSNNPHDQNILKKIDVHKCSSQSEDGKCYLDNLINVMDPYTIASWDQWRCECQQNDTINLD